MAARLALFKFVAKAALNYVGGGFGGDFIIEVLPEIANDLWQWWGKDRPVEQLRQEIQDVAQLSPVEVARQVGQAVAEEAAQRPETEQAALTAYLSLIPAAIRQSQRRASDPTGRTMSLNLSLIKSDDMLPLLPARLPRFKPGDRPLGIGDLELVELLGAGGFGEVWKARNPHFDGFPPVALKFCLDTSAKDRLLRHEAAILNRVMRQGSHPGIVRLQHAYLSAAPPCLEYEYVAGGDLGAVIRDARPSGGLPPRQAARIIEELAGIIGFAHQLTPPIVHRDLKPANILVQRTADGKWAFRVTDFGIGGIAATQAIGQSRLGATSGQLLVSSLRGSYTPLYASPQQMQGNPPDPRDDVYSLGIIWYQLLTGDLFMGAQSGSAWKKRLAEKNTPAPLVELLEDCINYMPADRPANAAVLAERITAIIKPPPSVPTSTPSPSSPPESLFTQEMKAALEEMRTKGDNRTYFERQGPSRIGAWQAAAQQGDVIGQWLLACCLYEGTGAQKDTTAGASWLRRAAESGLAVAQTDLGDCYYLGEGVKADSSEAFRLYTKAAEQGFTEAQVDLGDCYYEGEGVVKDPAEAARHYRKGADAGWARGQNSLGDCYYEGCGVEQDYPQAIGWYRRAADQGLASAQLNLGWCYEKGRGVKKNRGEAVKWFHKAAEQNNVVAQYSLGYCYELGYGVEPDLAQAEQWYRKAADQGHRKAKNALRRLEEEEGADKGGAEEKDDGVESKKNIDPELRVSKFRLMVLRAVEALGGERVECRALHVYTTKKYGWPVDKDSWKSNRTGNATYNCCVNDETLEAEQFGDEPHDHWFSLTDKGRAVLEANYAEVDQALAKDGSIEESEEDASEEAGAEPPGTKLIRERWLTVLRLLLQKGATSPDSAVKFSTFRVEAKAAGGIMYGYDGLSDAGLIEWMKREDEAGWFLCLTAAGRAALDAKST